ncbi:hypothetical protein [Kitasatospora sp. NPDC059571]|uniref:hypothetical protein n=1 Tax=Kitasatospora sp. NPDC059571 TaxID=3346871 RepID=UPI0036B2139B
MGFTGDVVLARSGRPLRELAWFAAGCAEGGSTCVSACNPRPGGWQTLQILHGMVDDSVASLRALVEATAAPVLVAHVMDSDVCWTRGLAPSGARWSTVLDPVMAADYGVPGPFPDASEEITRWAAEAGFAADPAALGEVLVKRADPFAEDLVFELIDACGFPPRTSDGPSASD